MEDHLAAQCRVMDMTDDQLMEMCNDCADSTALSALALAVIDELMRRGVVRGALGLATAPVPRKHSSSSIALPH
jgi:hypothetical protein